jgi:hypothetical protein
MVEKVKFDRLKKIKNIEIRKYPKIIIASVKGKNDDAAFGLLFNYISGSNKRKKKIKMTAPVINSEKIEMTAPVLTQDDYMAFILPSNYEIDKVPIPLDHNIKIKIVPERYLAVIRFSGYSTNNKINKFKEKLIMELKTNNIKVQGNPILMRYNSPFAPPFIRRNEIGVEIEYDKI